MEKQQILSLIDVQLQAGVITKDDLRVLADGAGSASVPAQAVPRKNIVNVFYGIGAIVVLTGIVILVAQHWTDIGATGRLLVTLGIAIVSYIVGMSMRAHEQRVISQVFFTLTAVLSPLGAYVLLNNAGLAFGLTEQIWTALLVGVLLIVAWLFTKRDVLAVFVALYAAWAYYALILEYVRDIAYGSDVLTWATIVLGASYVLVGSGYALVRGGDVAEGRSVRTVLYFLGGLAMLGAGITLDGIWDIVYALLIFATFYLSVFLRTRTLLVLSGIFLIAHLVHVTSKYFADTIGWPIVLVASGFFIIGIGYATFYVMKRFMK